MSKLIIILFTSFLISQECDDNRYLDEIFDVEVETWVEYGENVNDNVGIVTLYMDVYQPVGDDLEERPLAIFLFGGAFMFGTRTSVDIVSQCESYAKRGYVTAAIDYRLTPSLVFDNSEENVYGAVVKGFHDLKGAIRYFRKSANEGNPYRIDPSRIYSGGTSAGSIIAIHGAYMDEEDDLLLVVDNILNDVGGFEGESGNPGYSSAIHGVINLCGGIGDANWISENNQPIVSLHGTLDEIVPYAGGINLLGVYTEGSYLIHERMLELGNDSDLLTFEGGSHCEFLEDMSMVNQFTSEFMYNFVCAEDDNISGDVNSDGSVNVVDVLTTVNIILNDDFSSYADVNGDGAVNVVDILAIVNIILGSSI